MALHNLAEFFRSQQRATGEEFALRRSHTSRMAERCTCIKCDTRFHDKARLEMAGATKGEGEEKSSTRHSRRARAQVPGVRRASLGDEYALCFQAKCWRVSD